MPRDRNEVAADRQVARFEDGELWSDHEASTPENPAGWYFRPRGGGASTPWIGPFPTADAARAAPCRGGPLAAARRRLDDWARSRAEAPGPRRRTEAPALAPAAAAPPAPAPAPLPPDPPAESPRQLTLGLPLEAGGPAPEALPRPRPRRRGGGASPGAQEELPV